jgi:hypothetical protein
MFRVCQIAADPSLTAGISSFDFEPYEHDTI